MFTCFILASSSLTRKWTITNVEIPPPKEKKKPAAPPKNVPFVWPKYLLQINNRWHLLAFIQMPNLQFEVINEDLCCCFSFPACRRTRIREALEFAAQQQWCSSLGDLAEVAVNHQPHSSSLTRWTEGEQERTCTGLEIKFNWWLSYQRSDSKNVWLCKVTGRQLSHVRLGATSWEQGVEPFNWKGHTHVTFACGSLLVRCVEYWKDAVFFESNSKVVSQLQLGGICARSQSGRNCKIKILNGIDHVQGLQV